MHLLARWISLLFHPLAVPFVLLLVLWAGTPLFAGYPAGLKWYLLWVAALFTAILPLLAVVAMRTLGWIADYRLQRRRERLIPLAVGAVCCLLGALTLAKVPSAFLLRRMFLAAAACEVFSLAVTPFWKISLHLTSMGGAVALLAVCGVAGVCDRVLLLPVAVLCAGALASARLCLGSHNPWQVLAGFAAGASITSAVLLLG